MSRLSPRMAKLQAQVAANARVSRPDYDGTEATKQARDGYWRALELEVDPRGELSSEERLRKAKAKWREKMARAQLKKARTEARRKGRG